MATSRDPATDSEEVEALVATSKIVTAVVAHSLVGSKTVVTPPQLRVLVMLESRGPLNLTAIAEGLDVNPSNASRTCDQLVSAGLLTRREDATDRRAVSLRLSRKGAALVTRLMDHRRLLFAELLERIGAADRRALVQGLNALLRATESASHDSIEVDGHHHPFRWLA